MKKKSLKSSKIVKDLHLDKPTSHGGWPHGHSGGYLDNKTPVNKQIEKFLKDMGLLDDDNPRARLSEKRNINPKVKLSEAHLKRLLKNKLLKETWIHDLFNNNNNTTSISIPSSVENKLIPTNKSFNINSQNSQKVIVINDSKINTNLVDKFSKNAFIGDVGEALIGEMGGFDLSNKYYLNLNNIADITLGGHRLKKRFPAFDIYFSESNNSFEDSNLQEKTLSFDGIFSSVKSSYLPTNDGTISTQTPNWTAENLTDAILIFTYFWLIKNNQLSSIERNKSNANSSFTNIENSLKKFCDNTMKDSNSIMPHYQDFNIIKNIADLNENYDAVNNEGKIDYVIKNKLIYFFKNYDDKKFDKFFDKFKELINAIYFVEPQNSFMPINIRGSLASSLIVTTLKEIGFIDFWDDNKKVLFRNFSGNKTAIHKQVNQYLIENRAKLKPPNPNYFPNQTYDKKDSIENKLSEIFQEFKKVINDNNNIFQNNFTFRNTIIEACKKAEINTLKMKYNGYNLCGLNQKIVNDINKFELHDNLYAQDFKFYINVLKTSDFEFEIFINDLTLNNEDNDKYLKNLFNNLISDRFKKFLQNNNITSSYVDTSYADEEILFSSKSLEISKDLDSLEKISKDSFGFLKTLRSSKKNDASYSPSNVQNADYSKNVIGNVEGPNVFFGYDLNDNQVFGDTEQLKQFVNRISSNVTYPDKINDKDRLMPKTNYFGGDENRNIENILNECFEIFKRLQKSTAEQSVNDNVYLSSLKKTLTVYKTLLDNFKDESSLSALIGNTNVNLYLQQTIEGNFVNQSPEVFERLLNAIIVDNTQITNNDKIVIIDTLKNKYKDNNELIQILDKIETTISNNTIVENSTYSLLNELIGKLNDSNIIKDNKLILKNDLMLAIFLTYFIYPKPPGITFANKDSLLTSLNKVVINENRKYRRNRLLKEEEDASNAVIQSLENSIQPNVSPELILELFRHLNVIKSYLDSTSNISNTIPEIPDSKIMSTNIMGLEKPNYNNLNSQNSVPITQQPELANERKLYKNILLDIIKELSLPRKGKNKK